MKKSNTENTNPGNHREAIIQTAVQLFSDRGVDYTSMRMIARQAKVSTSLSYNYFASKEDLVREIVRRGQTQILQTLEPLAHPTQCPGGMREYLQRVCATLRKETRLWRVIHQVRLQKQWQEHAAVNEKMLSDIIGIFRQHLGCNKTRAALVFAMVDGLTSMYLLFGEEYPLEETAEEILQSVKTGRKFSWSKL